MVTAIANLGGGFQKATISSKLTTTTILLYTVVTLGSAFGQPQKCLPFLGLKRCQINKRHPSSTFSRQRYLLLPLTLTRKMWILYKEATASTNFDSVIISLN